MSDRSALLRRYLREEVNRSLVTGGRVAASLGFVSGVFVAVLDRLQLVQGMLLPAFFGVVCGAYCLVVSEVARRGRFRGQLANVLSVSFATLPTWFFLTAHWTLPSGAATYITGPFSYVYFAFIILSGFLFDERVSIATGVVSAAGYLLVYALDRQHLSALSASDATLLQDMTAVPIYFVKAMIMLGSGVLVAALSTNFRRITTRVLDEEQERGRINRLFGQYVSDEVREHIVSAKSATTAEQKLVAVLFSDIRSFSLMSERVTPEEIVRQLNEYFDAMVDAVTSSGGVVDKFIGDAIMAVFGGVLDVDNPSAAAFAAARKMRAALHLLNARWRAEGRPPYDCGIGLHFGEVVQGSIGAENRKDFTVIGDAVNTASRIEGFTKQLTQRIILSAELHQHLSATDRALCEDLGIMRARGMEKDIQVYGVGG